MDVPASLASHVRLRHPLARRRWCEAGTSSRTSEGVVVCWEHEEKSGASVPWLSILGSGRTEPTGSASRCDECSLAAPNKESTVVGLLFSVWPEAWVERYRLLARSLMGDTNGLGGGEVVALRNSARSDTELDLDDNGIVAFIDYVLDTPELPRLREPRETVQHRASGPWREVSLPPMSGAEPLAILAHSLDGFDVELFVSYSDGRIVRRVIGGHAYWERTMIRGGPGWPAGSAALAEMAGQGPPDGRLFAVDGQGKLWSSNRDLVDWRLVHPPLPGRSSKMVTLTALPLSEDFAEVYAGMSSKVFMKLEKSATGLSWFTVHPLNKIRSVVKLASAGVPGGRVDIFALTVGFGGGALMHAFRDARGPWSGWRALALPTSEATSRPTAISAHSGPRGMTVLCAAFPGGSVYWRSLPEGPLVGWSRVTSVTSPAPIRALSSCRTESSDVLFALPSEKKVLSVEFDSGEPFSTEGWRDPPE